MGVLREDGRRKPLINFTDKYLMPLGSKLYQSDELQNEIQNAGPLDWNTPEWGYRWV